MSLAVIIIMTTVCVCPNTHTNMNTLLFGIHYVCLVTAIMLGWPKSSRADERLHLVSSCIWYGNRNKAEQHITTENKQLFCYARHQSNGDWECNGQRRTIKNTHPLHNACFIFCDKTSNLKTSKCSWNYEANGFPHEDPCRKRATWQRSGKRYVPSKANKMRNVLLPGHGFHPYWRKSS